MRKVKLIIKKSLIKENYLFHMNQKQIKNFMFQ